MLLIPQEDVVGVTVAPVREVKKKNALQQKKHACLTSKKQKVMGSIPNKNKKMLGC